MSRADVHTGDQYVAMSVTCLIIHHCTSVPAQPHGSQYMFIFSQRKLGGGTTDTVGNTDSATCSVKCGVLYCDATHSLCGCYLFGAIR
jgi:hypothetical protein